MKAEKFELTKELWNGLPPEMQRAYGRWFARHERFLAHPEHEFYDITTGMPVIPAMLPLVRYVKNANANTAA